MPSKCDKPPSRSKRFRMRSMDGSDADLEILFHFGWRKRGLPSNDVSGLPYLGGAWLEVPESAAKRRSRALVFFYDYVYGYLFDARQVSLGAEEDHLVSCPFNYKIVGNSFYAASNFDESEDTVDDAKPISWSYEKGLLNLDWAGGPLVLAPTSFDEIIEAGFENNWLMMAYAQIDMATNGEFEEEVGDLPLRVPDL